MTPAELAALGIRIKPLVWEENPAREYHYFAGEYQVIEIGLGKWWMRISGVHRDMLYAYCHQAKAAAEADHAARICAQLEVME
jgi:hypothetical protein